MDVSKLIADLAAQNVSSFKGYGIEVSFHYKYGADKPSPPENTLPEKSQKIATNPPENRQTEAPTDPGFAQSFEGELSYDKILNWSGSPDPLEPETPLTGDAVPLTNEQS